MESFSYKAVLEIAAGDWPFFNIWPTKIHFGQPNLLYIFNGKAINSQQNVPSSRKDRPISDSDSITVSNVFERRLGFQLLSNNLGNFLTVKKFH